jgi:FIMAH domain
MVATMLPWLKSVGGGVYGIYALSRRRSEHVGVVPPMHGTLAATTTVVRSGDFRLGPVAPLTIAVGGTGSVGVAVTSYGGFNSAVSLAATGAPTATTATLNPASVIPPSGGSASAQLSVTAGPSVAVGSYALAIHGTVGAITHSTPVTLTITATPAGVTQVIGTVQALGCIDSSGIVNALTAKLAQAQAFIAAGDIQSAVNTLTALLHQLDAQAGKHIKTTCTDANGNTFDPVQVLIADVQALLTSLGAASIKPNPVMGNTATTSCTAVGGATVSLVNSAKSTVASTNSDVTGFYFFAKTSVLTRGATYAVVVKPPKPYKSATSDRFTWTATEVTASSTVR